MSAVWARRLGFSAAVVSTLTMLAIIGLSLSGCATPPMPKSASQAVYALEGQYAAALAVGAAYTDLPRCPSARDGLCSDQQTVNSLRNAVKVTGPLLQTAEVSVRLGKPDASNALLIASSMVSSLSAITSTLKTK